jgi:N-acyl-D-aspartate/D-glutamate deacylase
MTWDLKIKGGTIVDGTGAPAYAGDVAISDGRIVAVGKCDGAALEEIDADGALVTPGFVDIHTHYDGQVSWDADLQPSSVHGVTTAVMGSCGVGFAPVREADHARLIELMEGVEDIPGSALAEGLTWDWESFPEYMDAIGSRPHAIDFCAQVTHDPLRVFVMGERAMANEEATETDIAEMRRLLRESLRAGAVGFSTGRTDNHRSVKGEHTPAAEANERELAGLAEAFVGLNHGVLQAVSDFDMFDGKQRFDAEFDLVERMARISGRPTSVSLMQRDQDTDQWQRIMARAERATANGTPIHMQVAARAIGVILGLETTFQPFMGFASYKSIAHLPLVDRVAAMRNPDFKAQLLTEKSERLAGDGSPIPPLADMLLAQVDVIAMRMFTLGEIPDYEPSLADSIGMRAKNRGEPVLSALYDALLENEGQALLYFPLYNYIDGNLDNVHTMLSHPLALPGLSDGGAHVGTICDATFPTFLLTHWARDRKRGGFAIEKVVKMQTHDTARFIGMHDRGTLAVGQRADINVIDHANLRLLPPQLVSDLPAGGRRLLQRAEGYVATLVHGQVIARDGYLTGKRPGQLVRLGV